MWRKAFVISSKPKISINIGKKLLIPWDGIELIAYLCSWQGIRAHCTSKRDLSGIPVVVGHIWKQTAPVAPCSRNKPTFELALTQGVALDQYSATYSTVKLQRTVRNKVARCEKNKYDEWGPICVWVVKETNIFWIYYWNAFFSWI